MIFENLEKYIYSLQLINNDKELENVKKLLSNISYINKILYTIMINYKNMKIPRRNQLYNVENLWIIINNFNSLYRYNIIYYSLCYCKKNVRNKDIDIIINPYNYPIKRINNNMIDLIKECFSSNNFKNINNDEYKEIHYLKRYIFMFVFYYINKNECVNLSMKKSLLIKNNIIEYIDNIHRILNSIII